MNAKTADTVQTLSQLLGKLLEGAVPGSDAVVEPALILEQIAITAAKGYQAEVGQPIDPSKFTFEAPLEEAPAPSTPNDTTIQTT